MFRIKAESGGARAGILHTAHGKVETPFFMAVATKGAVKLITTDELKEMGAEAVISNAFMLYLKPGLDVIKEHGGLHKMMNWNKTIFTDCGGFQVLSFGNGNLGEKGFHLKTSSKGIEFRSPFDGTKHLLTPKKLMEIQNRLNSDVAMGLDHMPLYPCSKEEAKLSLDHTHKWMQECKELHKNKKQLLFGIAQGSFYPDLRRKSIKFIDSLDFDGIAFGGLAIGEPREKTFQMIKISSENCSQEKPRYVMGLGTPQDILRAISMGVDCFDSVFPTRTARHGNIFTHNGAVSIENSAFKHDYSRLDEDCKCKVCRNHTKSYIHHLFKTREPLGLRLASYHNLYFIQNMLSEARKAIKEDRYNKFMKDFLKRYERKKKAKTAKK